MEEEEQKEKSVSDPHGPSKQPKPIDPNKFYPVDLLKLTKQEALKHLQWLKKLRTIQKTSHNNDNNYSNSNEPENTHNRSKEATKPPIFRDFSKQKKAFEFMDNYENNDPTTKKIELAAFAIEVPHQTYHNPTPIDTGDGSGNGNTFSSIRRYIVSTYLGFWQVYSTRSDRHYYEVLYRSNNYHS